MKEEKETLRRITEGLYHLQRGLIPFVEHRMKERYRTDWQSRISRAQHPIPTPHLDTYSVLKTILDSWHDVFAAAFDRSRRHAARNFVSVAFEARNTTAHLSCPLEDGQALRYLDAMHELLRMAKAPTSDVSALKQLYDEQRREGIKAPPAMEVIDLKPRAEPTLAIPTQRETIADRLLQYIRDHPDLDDDELSLRLGIRPRQSINMAARRLEAQGRLARFRGNRGKIVNRARLASPDL